MHNESSNRGAQPTITMYATPWCGDCRLARRWFDTHHIAYTYINIEKDEEAAATVMRLNHGMRSVPTILFPDGSALVEPDSRQLAAKCSLEPPPTLKERVTRLWQKAELAEERVETRTANRE